MAHSLADFAQANPSAATILESPVTSTEAVSRLAELGVSSSRTAVKRYRARYLPSHPLVGAINAATITEAPPSPLGKQPSAPGWNVGSWFDYVKGEGEFTTAPAPAGQHEDLDDAELLAEFGLDPELFEVTAARRSLWQQKEDGPWLEAKRVSVRRRTPELEARVPSLEELSQLRDYVPLIKTTRLPTTASGTLVVATGDYQTGKALERRGGTPELWERVRATMASVVSYVSEHGRPERIVLIHSGDCIEGNQSQGGRLIKRQDLSLTQQIETYGRLLEFQVIELASIAPTTIVVVNGNHDSVATRDYEPEDLSEGWATFAARQAQRFIGAARPDLDVQWCYPERDHLAVEFEAAPGFWMTAVHGHKIAANPEKVMQWWKGQAFGQMPGYRSTVLVTGHWHHLRLNTAGSGKFHLQVPNFDGGSSWWANKSGDDAEPGLVTFWLEPELAYPIQELRVHSGSAD